MAKKVDEKSSNLALWITGIVVVVIIIALVTDGFGLLGHGGNNQTPSTLHLSIGEAPVIGNFSAPVTIYEFVDFSCPFCGALEGGNQQVISSLQASNPGWEPSIPNIIKDYVDTGKVRLVFKSFQTHNEGKAAHQVGWCLNDQGLFWKFAPEAFADQANVGNLSKMESLAESLGANMTELKSCVSSGKYDHLFVDDQKMGQANGITATPTLFINNQEVVGAQSYSDIKAIIDNELNEAS